MKHSMVMQWSGLATLAAVVALLAACASATTPPAHDPDSPPFVIGGDVSFLPQIEDHGGIYSDAQGRQDLLRLLKDHGFTPCGDCGTGGTVNTLERVLAMARRIEAAGMLFLLDIHYSDWWADPQKQIKPKAWEGLPFDVLTDSVYRYTRAVVGALRAQGTTPTLVQLGNEIRPGMIWPEGRVDSTSTHRQWDHLRPAARWQARRARCAEKPPRIMIHFDTGARNAMCRAFFDRLLERQLEFDDIGLSFYPKWHGTLAELKSNLADLAVRYGKDVYVVETAYPWTFEWRDQTGNILGSESDLHPGYPPTVAGQAAFLRAVHETVRAVPGERGRGIFYWAPEWIAVTGVPSAWENATLFDFDGKALSSMESFTGRW
jgi:arabinogalactan endo-1,4-beta-galactosidase